jgi:hypothetical protein
MHSSSTLRMNSLSRNMPTTLRQSLAPPIVELPAAAGGPAVVELPRGIPTTQARPDRVALEGIAARAPTVSIDAKSASSPVERIAGLTTFGFALHPAKGYTGLVLLPDGKPAPGVEVALGTQANRVSMQSGHFDCNGDFPKTSTGPDGGFTFAARDDKFFLVAVSAAGFAEVWSDELAKSGKLVLQPWERIEGGVRIGARLGSDQEVMFEPERPCPYVCSAPSPSKLIQRTMSKGAQRASGRIDQGVERSPCAPRSDRLEPDVGT